MCLWVPTTHSTFLNGILRTPSRGAVSSWSARLSWCLSWSRIRLKILWIPNGRRTLFFWLLATVLVRYLLHVVSVAATPPLSMDYILQNKIISDSVCAKMVRTGTTFPAGPVKVQARISLILTVGCGYKRAKQSGKSVLLALVHANARLRLQVYHPKFTVCFLLLHTDGLGMLPEWLSSPWTPCFCQTPIYRKRRLNKI